MHNCKITELSPLITGEDFPFYARETYEILMSITKKYFKEGNIKK